MQLTSRLPTKAKLQETGSLALCLQPPANQIGLRGQSQLGFSAHCLNRGTSKRSNVCLPCLFRPPHPSSLGVAPPAQPLLTVAPLTLAHQQILSGIKEEKKECGEGGVAWGVGLRLGLCRSTTCCFFLGPLFFLSAGSVFGRAPGGRETMARCAHPGVQRRLAGASGRW